MRKIPDRLIFSIFDLHEPGDTLLSLYFKNPFIQVGSGYSKKELSEFNQKLADHWKIFDKKKPPTNIILASGFKEKPDAWIEPEHSRIVQVCLSNILQDR